MDCHSEQGRVSRRQSDGGNSVSSVILAIERTRAARLRGLKIVFGKLSVSENRFRQMNEQSPLGIIVFAPDGSIRAVNRAYEDFWRIKYEQIKDWDFFPEEQLIRIGVVEKLRQAFAGETVHFPPEPYKPHENNHGIAFVENATMPWFESFAYPVKSDVGELLEVILVMEDVTDTKRADEIEQKAKVDRLRELEQVRRKNRRRFARRHRLIFNSNFDFQRIFAAAR